MDPNQSQSPSQIPLPPGYTQDQIIDAPASTSNSGAIPPPPGYSSSQVIDNSGFSPSQAPPVQPQSVLTMNDNDSIGTDVLKAGGGLLSGIGEGVFGTGAGLVDLTNKILDPLATTLPNGQKDHIIPQGVSSYLHNLAGDNEQQAGWERVGQGTESIAEFIMGDAALKGLSTSEKLLQASKAVKVIEDSPVLNRIFQAGVRAVRGGIVGTIQGGVKSGGDPSQAIAGGVGGAVGNALVPEAIDALKATPKAIKGAYTAISEALQGAEKVVQPELQTGISNILKQVAAEHGITIPDGTAMRDAAEHVGQEIKNQASSIYSKIDDALGGTDFKSVNRQLDAAQRAFNADTGFDPDVTGRLIEHLNHLEDFKANLRQTAMQAGIPEDAFTQADKLWRQGSAMQDLSAKIRQSTTGLPDNLRDGSKSANQANPEVVSPSKLVPKIHMLRDSGRLSQALTQDLSAARGNDLLRTVEAAKARSADIASTKKIVGKVATGLAHAAGTGAVGGAVVHHLVQ